MAENQISAQSTSTSSSISPEQTSISDTVKSYSSDLQELKKIVETSTQIVTAENMKETTLEEIVLLASFLYRSDSLKVADQQIQDTLKDFLLRLIEKEQSDMEKTDEYQSPPNQPIPQTHRPHQQLPQPEGHQPTQLICPPSQEVFWQPPVFKRPKQGSLRLPRSKGRNVAQKYQAPRTRSQTLRSED
ncbi:84a64e43-8836-4a7e-a1a9-44dbac704193-CDS [Sclerotinia trifoliorum]|uniref:84a64e43-8836-4a7e-a1a9-44dbac704193-CDS n=1 Tax=Sclerotinia trifoliorum TaxID=28548 RepID=A0A8H2VKY1_9HELO|nr:84a64e43-8836-4a7e-a1a9-44dbac704193-CDS [Sclerotinia trifoliorum]